MEGPVAFRAAAMEATPEAAADPAEAIRAATTLTAILLAGLAQAAAALTIQADSARAATITRLEE